MKKKEKKVIDWRVVCFGLMCITAIELYALSQGINGIILSSVFILIGGTIGATFPQLKTKLGGQNA